MDDLLLLSDDEFQKYIGQGYRKSRKDLGFTVKYVAETTGLKLSDIVLFEGGQFSVMELTDKKLISKLVWLYVNGEEVFNKRFPPKVVDKSS